MKTDIPIFFYDLIEKFQFSQLNKSQKESVLQFMDEQEYSLLRGIALTAEFELCNDDNYPEIPSDIGLKLNSEFDRRFAAINDSANEHSIASNTRILNKIIKWNIPLYQAAAAAVLLLAVGIYGNRYLSNQTQISSTDTVVVVKEVTSLDTVFISELHTPDVNKLKHPDRSVKSLIAESETVPEYKSIRKKGITLVDDKEMQELFKRVSF